MNERDEEVIQMDEIDVKISKPDERDVEQIIMDGRYVKDNDMKEILMERTGMKKMTNKIRMIELTK